jgi:hypothetical protein
MLFIPFLYLEAKTIQAEQSFVIVIKNRQKIFKKFFMLFLNQILAIHLSAFLKITKNATIKPVENRSETLTGSLHKTYLR